MWPGRISMVAHRAGDGGNLAGIRVRLVNCALGSSKPAMVGGMILANLHNLDPGWWLVFEVAAVVILFFAFRTLFRERRRMRGRISEQVDRLARIEQKLDELLHAPPAAPAPISTVDP